MVSKPGSTGLRGTICRHAFVRIFSVIDLNTTTPRHQRLDYSHKRSGYLIATRGFSSLKQAFHKRYDKLSSGKWAPVYRISTRAISI